MRKILCFITLALLGPAAMASTSTITVQPNSIVAGIAINVPSSAKLLTLKTSGGVKGKLDLYLRPNADFDTQSNLDQQAVYSSQNNSGNASLSIGKYNAPALHAGKWYVAIANHSASARTIRLDATTSTNDEPDTQFVINFDQPSAALTSTWGGADNLDCDVAPWNDPTPVGNTTLGKFRQQLLKDATEKLGEEIHSPVPVHIQACWKQFDDSGSHAGSYTLAAATGVYFFYNSPGAPLTNTWYAEAPTARLAGTRACNIDSSVDCSIPDIVVWYNSADAAKESYDDTSDENLIVSVTMHEITHGLGFLAQVALTNPSGCDANPPTSTDCDNIGTLWDNRMDAYTANVAFLKPPADHPLGGGDRTVVAFGDLSQSLRKAALTSNTYLVWNDAATTNADDNVLRDDPAPGNLVKLHAPRTIQPGSTLSHLHAIQGFQLMTAVIAGDGQGHHPQTLGLAEPMLERVGWNTGTFAAHPSSAPATGSWYDPAHNGHGFDIERMVDDPAGDQYAVIFYSYDASGKSEYYYSSGRLRGGSYEDSTNAGQPAPMGRPIYDPAGHKATYPGQLGTLSIDFSSAAASDPACAGNTQPKKALLKWSIGGDSGTWCVSPLVTTSNRPDEASDLTGLWDAGDADSGWGLSIQESTNSSGAFLSPFLVFFPGTDNQPHWAQAEVSGYHPGQTVNLYRINGYCRTCAKQATTHDVIGTMTLNLNQPERSGTPSGVNRVTIDINGGGTLQFRRNNVPVRTASLPAGD